MTSRDFELIAKTLKELKPPHYESDAYTRWHKAVVPFARMCKSTNERFDVQVFTDACGV